MSSKREHICGIYRIINKQLDKVIYIGQSIDVEQRINRHKHEYNRNTSGYHSFNSHLYRHLRKFGINNFEFELLQQCEKDKLDEREIYWIWYYHTDTEGCNSTKRGKHAIPYNLASLTVAEIQLVQELLQQGENYSKIEAITRATLAVISDINSRKIYKDKNLSYPLQQRKPKIGNYKKAKREKSFCPICGEVKQKSSSLCRSCYNKSKAKSSKKPSKEILQNEIQAQNGCFEKIALIYNVSSNTIRNWCRSYNLPCHTEDYKIIPQKITRPQTQPKPVAQLDKDTLSILKVFPSIGSAQRFIGATYNYAISECCKGMCKTVKGYKWKYLTQEEYNLYINQGI